MKRTLVAASLVATALVTTGAVATAGSEHHRPGGPPSASTSTPIRHLVVIFQENVSFDHYFATYPNAANPADEPSFSARRGTPSVNGLNTPLLVSNPNSVPPFRLDRSQAYTCDQDHSYTDEQRAFDSGLMDRFVESVGRPRNPSQCDYGHGPGLVMGYFDGNTVTAMWNYAQHFAMSDNSYGTTFGPSTPGALNLASGQTHGFIPGSVPPGADSLTAAGTVIGDPQPDGDICDTRGRVTASPENAGNVGDLLNGKDVTWGWFQGGFRDCTQTHTTTVGVPQTSKDYIPHHEPFQYYRSTANPSHTPPASPAEIGRDGPANHQYDLTDFWTAVERGTMPAVSFLKAPAYEDGHAGYSNPLDEQRFLVETINRLQRTREWRDMAIVIAYDDSDGWYDHQMGPIVNQSNDPLNDALTDDDTCGVKPEDIAGGYQDRCGYGPRLPLLVISRYAKSDYVDHSTTDQTSILRFIEDNWSLGRIGDASFDSKAGSLENLFDFTPRKHGLGARRLLLDPATGEPLGRDGD
jgi:phospholipase C